MSSAWISFDVPGVPVTEGSTRAYPTTDGRHVRVTHDKANELEAWRTLIRAMALQEATDTGWPLGYDGPVEVAATFFLPRPQRPRWAEPAVKPDLDKLARALGDAITEDRHHHRRGLIREDSRIVAWHLRKEYAKHQRTPGIAVIVSQLTEEHQ